MIGGSPTQRKISGGKGTANLFGMTTIVVDVEHVVQHIRCRRAQAESDDGQDDFDELVNIVQLMREDQRKQEQGVLCPLRGAQRCHHRSHARPLPVHADFVWLTNGTRTAQQARAAGDHVSGPCLGPDRQISGMVRDIVKSLRAGVADRAKLLLSLEIPQTIAAQNRVEDFQVIRNPVGNATVSGGGQNQALAGGFPLMQKVDYLPAIWEVLGSDRRSRGEPLLQSCTAGSHQLNGGV